MNKYTNWPKMTSQSHIALLCLYVADPATFSTSTLFSGGHIFRSYGKKSFALLPHGYVNIKILSLDSFFQN